MSDGRLYDGFLPGRYPFDAYGNGGFRFADMSHRGSLLALPSGIRAWPVGSVAELTDEALDPVFAEADAIDLLLLGTGTDIAAIPASFRTRFREAGIGLDVMQTGAAARTYNILLGENRKVGAALIAVP
ncbi:MULTISPECIES: Mth938-like domain-containing protein [Microvirga]|uniref:Mth938-like domain-containing protein n=1 Tax=Microvirga TaxID=186650 RepID=UPI0021C8670F|nr:MULTISPECIES: MTH938/NDUFAF3 family protein [unclassified Microvirga]